MRFRCPCCKIQVVPSKESVEEDAQSRSDGTESNDQFVSTVVEATDSQEQFELTTDVPEVVVDTAGDSRSILDTTDSAASSGSLTPVQMKPTSCNILV